MQRRNQVFLESIGSIETGVYVIQKSRKQKMHFRDLEGW